MSSDASESASEDEQAPPSMPCATALKSTDALKDLVTYRSLPVCYLAQPKNLEQDIVKQTCANKQSK